MKVGVVSTWQTACGIAGYTGKLVDALRAGGTEIEVVPIDRAPLIYLTESELSSRFAKLARDLDGVDVIHIQHEFGFFAGAYGYTTSTRVFGRFLAALEKLGRPVVVTFHTEPLFFAAAQRTPQELLRRAYYKAWWRAGVARRFSAGRTRAVVHTRTSRRMLLDAGIPAARTTVIPQGVEVRDPLPPGTRPTALERFGIPADATVIGVFGFLSSVKGHVTAIQALRHLPAEYHLLIGGDPHPHAPDGTLESVLKVLERRPELRDRVHLAGHLDEEALEHYLAAVDIAAAPYLEQPRLSSSAAVTWALTAGKPIVASRIPAFVELAENSAAVQLVNPRSPRELARAVVRLASDDEHRRRLQENASRYAAKYSWQRVASEHLDLYAMMAAEQRPRRTVTAGARRVAGAATRVARRASASRGDVHAVTATVGGAPPVTFMVRPHQGDPISDWLIAHRMLNDPPNELTLGLLRSGGRFVDVGAHLGTFTMPAAAQGCDVIAIEASPTNADLLRRAVEANDFRRVTVVHAIGGAASGSARFTPHGPWGHRSLPGEAAADVETVELPIAAVDELVAQAGWPSVELLKVDVEGGEPDVLDGARELLSRDDAPIVVLESNAEMLEHYGHRADDLRLRLAEWGFSLFLVDRHEERTLVPVQARTVQVDCVADYVATKRPLDLPDGWRIAEPFDDGALAERMLETARSSHWPYRRYAARTLRTSAAWLCDRDDVRAGLELLKADDEPEVRRAAADDPATTRIG